MKIWRLAGIIVTSVLSGCIKVEPATNPTPNDDIIRVNAAIEGSSVEAATKGVVYKWKNTQVSFGYGRAANNYGAHWDAQITEHGKVIFSPVKAYAADFSPVHLKGFHPRGGIRNNDCNQVYFELTGQEDIMVSNNLNMGTLDNKRDEDHALFKHLLTQFTFTVLNDPSSPYPPISAIKRVEVYAEDALNPLGSTANLDLRTNTLTFTASGAAMVAYSPSMGDGVKIKYGEHKDLMQVMFEPHKKVRLYVEYIGAGDRLLTSNEIIDIPSPAPGTAYEIVMRYSGSGISTAVNVVAWKAGTVPSDQGGSNSNPSTIW